MHRGFFYQHLYSVALLLTLGRQEGAILTTERDEDIELRLNGATHYIQVKTRQGLLQLNHIADALDRFEELRNAHVSGDRSGRARFFIVANSELGPRLAEQVKEESWPVDVEVVTPLRPSSFELPLVGTDINSMIAILTSLAAELPFGGLAVDTLVLKLATLIQFAATGGRTSEFQAADMPALLEQLVIQLQDFPEPPSPYWPQKDEPNFISEERVRLIIGFSGAGKTSWAAQSAQHSPEPLLYFDVGDLPARSVPTSLAREIVARFMGGRERGIGGVQLPPNGGIEALQASDKLLKEQGTKTLIVLDNVHRLSADNLRLITESAPNQSFIALGQPWAGYPLFEAMLGIQAEMLFGLDADAVASVFANEGVGVNVDAASNIIQITGGLPLFVVNAARIAKQQFGGDPDAFYRAILERTQDQDTAQDLILEGAFEALSPSAKNTAAFLAYCDVPLLKEEVNGLLQEIGNASAIASALRELRRSSMLVSFPRSGIGLHDALRPLAIGHGTGMDQTSIDSALERLHVLLIASLQQEQNIPRLTFLIRLLPRVGQTEALVDLATTEMFYEQGNMAMMWDVLVDAAEDETYTPRDRFWALDALAYWESRDGGTPSEDRLSQMEALVAQGGFDARERLNLVFKQLVAAGTAGDRKLIERLTAKGRKFVETPKIGQILRYNRAVALYRIGAWQAARNALEPLIDDCFREFGFPEKVLVGCNGPALLALLEPINDRDEVKRLADALNLWASCVVKQGYPPMMRRIQATKLYASAGAGRSAAVSAQEAANEMLKFMGSAEGARETMEQHVLPLIAEYHLTDLTLEARGEYAVILAYCDDFEGADRQIAALANYDSSPTQLELFNIQVNLIEEIRNGVSKIGPPLHLNNGKQLLLNPNQIGKKPALNDFCPCNSGRKFKRCHGK